jgi:hypothetical protein
VRHVGFAILIFISFHSIAVNFKENKVFKIYSWTLITQKEASDTSLVNAGNHLTQQSSVT